MLTSLIALYLVSNLEHSPAINTQTNAQNLIKTASYNFSNILDSVPIKNPLLIAPIIEAKSSIIIDIKTGQTLFEQDAHKRMAIASITKLMTILIILEDNQLNEVVTISNNAASTDGSNMDLQPGEQILVQNLLYGALINSANDAAVALAEHNAKTVAAFVEKMNERGRQLGLINTHFSNPIGLDDSNNYSSANDVSKMGLYIYQNKFIKEAAKIQQLEVYSLDGQYKHFLETTNDLLSEKHFKIKGLKTGSTQLAGLCLISVAENSQGDEIITVVLNSPARFTETKILIDWIFRAYNWI